MVKVSAIGIGGIDAIKNGRSMAGLRQTGTIGRSNGYGFARHGFSSFGDSNRHAGIYQKRVTGYNNTGRIATLPRSTYYVRMRHYRPTNPQSPLQQAQRAKMSAANIAWRELTPVDKSRYTERATRKNRVARQLFISEYLKSH